MEKAGDTGCRRLQSGLSRVELLLGFAQGVPTNEDLSDLNEEDVVFREVEETGSAGVYSVVGLTTRSEFQRKENKAKERSQCRHYQSAPVRVPQWGKRKGVFDDEDHDEMAVIPPHEFLAHYDRSNNTSFSVVEGIGRTLKGRDLCKVRNAVFKMTGLLD